ncbi:hypothetical protein [Kitasatospora sp. NBC_01302]|uniref:hypothetical protein n=1 Tax=Kitasatospora sp. NBC_01302 TaxID=2903575 RepID=UPI002E109B73|nr:hypothetical protein OG294_39435 [Kitasatospora sp. NBC_01302]
MARPHAEGLAEFVPLPQAGWAKAWHLNAQGAAAAATFPDARRERGGARRSRWFRAQRARRPAP